MKDMIKSKWMIIFIVFVLAMTYINSCCLEQKNVSTGNTDITNYKQK
jgi:YbbR domain-containing protein